MYKVKLIRGCVCYIFFENIKLTLKVFKISHDNITLLTIKIVHKVLGYPKVLFRYILNNILPARKR